MERHLQYLLQNGAYQYSIRNFKQVITIVSEANSFRQVLGFDPVFMHFDTLFMSAAIEEEIDPMGVVRMYLQNINTFGGPFFQVIESYTDILVFNWKLLNIGVKTCLEKDPKLFATLADVLKQTRLFQKKPVTMEFLLVLNFWSNLLEMYLEEAACYGDASQDYEHSYHSVGKDVIKEASIRWYARAQIDFYRPQNLGLAFTAFQIMNRLEKYLMASCNRDEKYLSISRLYLQAIELELFYDGDLAEFGNNSNNFHLQNEHNTSTRELWEGKARFAMKTKATLLVKFLMKSCILLALGENKPSLVPKYYTDLAYCWLEEDDPERAVEEICTACNTVNKQFIETETILGWKDLGSKLYVKKELRNALSVYEYALKCCKDSDTTLKRDLNSNISLMCHNLQLYVSASTAAERCIKLDRNWYKGYLRLAAAHYKMADFKNSLSTIRTALQLPHDKGTEEMLVLFFKNRAQLGKNDKEFPRVDQKVFLNTLTKLYEENTPDSWCAIENVVFSVKDARLTSSLRQMSLCQALQYKISLRLLDCMIENGSDVNNVFRDTTRGLFSPLKIALMLKLYKHAAKLMKHGALLEPASDVKQPPVMVAVKLVMQDFNIQLLTELFANLSKRDIYAVDVDGNNVAHWLCYGFSDSKKTSILKLLAEHEFDFGKGNRYGKTPIQLLQSRNSDPRESILRQSNPSANNKNKTIKVASPPRSNGDSNRTRQDSTSEKNKVYKPFLEDRDVGMKAFIEKDWRTAAQDFNKKIKKMRKKDGHEKRNCEVFVYCGLADLKLGTDKATQVFKWLAKAYGTHQYVTKCALPHACGKDFEEMLIGYVMDNCIKKFSDEQFESVANGKAILSKLLSDEKIGKLDLIEKSVQVCKSSLSIELFFGCLDDFTESFIKELCISWFCYSKRMFEKRKCDQASLTLVYRLSARLKECQVEAMARLHLSTHSFALECGKGKARDHFDKASECLKDSPKILCNEWLDKISALKSKDPQTCLFYIQVCVQLFLRRDFESAKFLGLMSDFATCVEKQKDLDENHFQTFLTAVKGIQIQDKNLSERMTTLGRKFQQKKNTVLLYRLALELTPDDAEDLKTNLCVDLTKHCFNLDQLDGCVKHADEAIKLTPDNKDCYMWKAKALSKKKLLPESRDVLIGAMKTFESVDDKKDFMIELCELEIPLDWSSSDFEIDSQLLDNVVESLVTADNSKSWKTLEKLALSLLKFNELLSSSVEIPLLRGLHFDVEQPFIIIVAERVNWRKIDKACIDKLIKKSFFDTLSRFILRKGMDRTIMDSPIVIATKLIINDGCKIKLINCVVGMLTEAEFHGTVKKAIQLCCTGDLTEKKKDILEILFIKADNKIQISHDYRKHMKTDEPRYKLFDQYKQGHVDVSKVPDAVKQKKKEKNADGGIVFDTSRNVDAELLKAITTAQFISGTTVDGKDGFQLLTNKDASEILSVPSVKGELSEEACAGSVMEQAIVDDYEVKEEEEDNEDDFEKELETATFEDTWEVECTQEVYRVLRSRKVPMTMKKKILNKIRQLASGRWPRDIQKRLEGVKEGITLYEAKINKASRIIWEISVSFSERRSMEQQISDLLDQGERSAIYEDKIRIWNIALHHDDVPKMIEKIEHSHDRGEDCILRKHLKGLKQEPSEHKEQKHPNVYMNEEYAKELVSKAIQKQDNVDRRNFLFVPAASPNKEEYNILKFYSFTSQVASRILSVSNANYDFPFQVSPLEYAVIKLEPKHKCAILLLGRSGTGKTTCCLYRLWSQFLNYWKTASLSGPQLPKFKPVPITEVEEKEEQEGDDTVETRPVIPPRPVCNTVLDEKPVGETTPDEKEMVEDCEHLRQVLVTKNEVLCNEIKKNFKELSIGTQVTHYEELEDLELTTIQDISPENYPLFVTTKDLFLLLDNSLEGDKFFERDEEGNMKHDIPGWGRNKVRLSFLPSMEEDSDDEEEGEGEEKEMKDEFTRKKVEQKVVKKREVTYEVFANEIWPKLIKKKGKGEKSCHPSLVWMEIKSFIKGSAEAFVSKDKEGRLTGYLTEEEYVNVGRKRAPNFEGSRKEIYDIFLRYLKLKSSSIYFDEMDVHFQLYKRVKATIIPDWAFHQIYLDETQDFTQSELLLLIRCSANPNAMFFTGDTAQSIMSGVAFRFCDLKSLYVVAKQEFESLKLPSPITVPSTVHQLTHNYRSHSGILKLSSTVVKLLELLFPASIEINAKPDIGLFPGPSPVILETDDVTELAILLQGSKRQTSAIEFGAHQVVLVQNEESKERLPAELSYGLVLSIYEAKGLEFDDVLLYNFFKDSPAYDEWRVIASNCDNVDTEIDEDECSLQVIPQEDLEYDYRPLDFDYSKHKLLNSELKKLYTAVTRARVNVWIFDEDKKKRAPMFDFLVKKKLADVARLEDGAVRDYFVEQSTKEEWDKQGKYFFGKGLWKLAMKCADKAEDVGLKEKCQAKMQDVKVCEAASEWQQKKSKRSLASVRNGFNICALSFMNCGLVEDAERSLKNASAYHLLALLYEKQKKFGEAAKQYKLAAFKEDALRCYKLAENHRLVMALLKSAKNYVEALRYQRDHNLSDVDKLELMNKALAFYEETSDYDSIKNVLEFSSFYYQQSYLRDKEDMHFMLEELYKKYNKHDDLAHLYIQKKKFLEAAKISRSLKEKVMFLIRACKEYAISRVQGVGAELKDLFSELIHDVKETTDPLMIAESYYCYSYLTAQTTFIQDAIKLFDFQLDHLGKLLCFRWLIKQDLVNKSGAFIQIDRPYRRMEELVKAILSLIESMHSTSRIHTGLVSSCLSKLGYQLVGGTYRIEDRSSFNFYHKLADVENIRSDHINRRQITELQAKSTTAKVLISILKDVIVDFRSLIKRQVHVNSVCQMTEKCSHADCGKLHQPPTLGNLNDAFQAIFCEIAINGYCSFSKQNLTKIETIYSTQGWMDLASTSLHMLHDLLQSYKPFLHLLKSDQFIQFFQQLHRNPRETLKNIMRLQWNDQVVKKTLNMDSYVGLSYFSYLIDKSKPFIDVLRMSKRERYYPFNLFDMYNESLEVLYYGSQIKRFFNKTFELLRRCQVINVGTFCDMIEVPIVLLFASISATSSDAHPYPFMVPSNYIHHCNLWDAMYGDNGFNKALSQLPKREHVWNVISLFIKELCEFLSQPNGFIKELVKISDYVETNPSHAVQLSRLLCVYLVLLSNLQQGLASHGKCIVQMFRSEPAVKKRGLLCDVFNKIREVKSSESATSILKSILKWRGDIIQQCEWNAKKMRLVKPGAIRPVKILKRGGEHDDLDNGEESFPSVNEAMGVDDYYKKDQADDDETDEKQDEEFEKIRQKRQQEARETALAREFYDKWRLFVDKRHSKRRKCYQKLIEYLASLCIGAWMLKCVQIRRSKTFIVESEAEESFEIKHFKFDKCLACNVDDAKNQEHIDDEMHIKNAELFDNYNVMKEDYDDAYDKFVDLDVQDNTMDTLCTRFRITTQVLILKKVILHPYTDELRKIVFDIIDRCNVLQSEHSRKLQEEENTFEKCESRKKKNLKRIGRGGRQ